MTTYTETQAFSPLAYGVLGVGTVAVTWATLTNWTAGAGYPLLILPLGALGLTFNLLCQRTVVTEQELIVTFGALLPLYRRRISRREIASAEAVTYSPLSEYGGWGIRGWGRNVCLNARGNRGVHVTLRDGRRILVGSQRPGELAAALRPPRPQ